MPQRPADVERRDTTPRRIQLIYRVPVAAVVDLDGAEVDRVVVLHEDAQLETSADAWAAEDHGSPFETFDHQDGTNALGRLGGPPRITAEDGTVIELPAPVAEALAEVLEAAADGERALVLRSPDNLTTEEAAAVLGVSRPTVVRLVEAGKLPARMVGTHRRLDLGDVLAYREASTRRRRGALEELTRQAEDLELYD